MSQLETEINIFALHGSSKTEYLPNGTFKITHFEDIIDPHEITTESKGKEYCWAGLNLPADQHDPLHQEILAELATDYQDQTGQKITYSFALEPNIEGGFSITKGVGVYKENKPGFLKSDIVYQAIPKLLNSQD